MHSLHNEPPFNATIFDEYILKFANLATLVAMSDIGSQLPSGSRNSVLLLQNLDRKQASLQKRLATGLKVTSALDGPQAFFSAKGLDSRSSKLQALKDTMGQALSSIQAADKGIESIRSLLEQAHGLTTSALVNLEDTPDAQRTRAALAEQFDQILSQIDRITGDSFYEGKNLLVGNGKKLSATATSRKLTSDIMGINGATVTNITKEDQYRINVTGSGQISGLDADIQNVEQLFGLKELKIAGQNSKTKGSFDDIRFELHGRPGRDVTLVVLDGDESWTVKFTAAELATMEESGTSQKISRTFGSGAEVSLDIDPKALQAALQPSGLVKASVQRDVDLQVTVTDTTGVSITRSADTQDSSLRLFAGENAFRFDSGTVRLDINPDELQEAVFIPDTIIPDIIEVRVITPAVEGGIIGDLGPFAGVLTDPVITYAGDEDVHVKLDAFRLTPYGANDANDYGHILTYVSAGDVAEQYGEPWANGSGIVRLGIDNGHHSVVFKSSYPSSGLINSTGTHFINTDFGSGLSELTTYDGGAGYLDPLTPYWSGWKVDSQLQITYGAAVGNQRYVTVDDGHGGIFAGYPEIMGSAGYIGEINVITISGGPNDGATIGLKDLVPNSPNSGSISIDVFADRQNRIFAPAGPAFSSLYQFDDFQHWGGFNTDSSIQITIGADGSDSPGFRSLTIDESAFNGSGGSSQTFSVPNGTHSDMVYTISGGPNDGAVIRFDIPAGYVQNSFAVMAGLPPASGIADFIIRRPRDAVTETIVHPGSVIVNSPHGSGSAVLSTVQSQDATTANDIKVPLNEDGSHELNIRSVNVQTDGEGLRLDRSVNAWRDRGDIEQAVSDLDIAGQRLEAASRELQTNNDVLNARMDFSEMMALTLSEGAMKLTEADQNEEAANSLLLTIRQQLTLTTFSLASAAQQSILRLFT